MHRSGKRSSGCSLTPHLPTGPHPVVAQAAREMLNKSDNELSGVFSTAMACLGLYRDPVVARNTAESDFRIADLMNADAPVSLYLVVPPSDLARTRPIVRLMLNQIGRRLTESMQVGAKTAYRHRLLLLLDEFPSLGRLEFFETALAFIAGYGLKAVLIAQSLNQLEKAYGPNNSILDNCHVRLAYAANDDRTARRISDLLGQATEKKAAEELFGLGPLSHPPQRERARVRPAPSHPGGGEPAPAGRRHPARRRPPALPRAQGPLLPRPALQGTRRPSASRPARRASARAAAPGTERVAGCECVASDAAPCPPPPAPDAAATSTEPEPHVALDEPEASRSPDAESAAPHDVWTGYFRAEAPEGSTPEGAEPEAAAQPERKTLPV